MPKAPQKLIPGTAGDESLKLVVWVTAGPRRRGIKSDENSLGESRPNAKRLLSIHAGRQPYLRSRRSKEGHTPDRGRERERERFHRF
jgi:hypothetical protein